MDDFEKRIEREKLELAKAYALAALGHTRVFVSALIGGFELTEEEGKTTVYAPPTTPDEVQRLAPIIARYETGVIAEVRGMVHGTDAGGGEEAQTPPDGMSQEEFDELKWLASTPAPGKLRPHFGGDQPAPAGHELTEEEMARIKTLAA